MTDTRRSILISLPLRHVAMLEHMARERHLDRSTVVGVLIERAFNIGRAVRTDPPVSGEGAEPASESQIATGLRSHGTVAPPQSSPVVRKPDRKMSDAEFDRPMQIRAPRGSIPYPVDPSTVVRTEPTPPAGGYIILPATPDDTLIVPGRHTTAEIARATEKRMIDKMRSDS